MVVQTFLLVPFNQGLSLRVIDHEALFDSLLVVVGTSALLSAQNQALHQFIFGHGQFNHGSYLVATLVEHLFQGLCLWDRAGETIEDDTLVLTSERVVYRCQDAYHQVVGNQLTVVDIALSRLAKFCTLLDFCTKYITCRDMLQSIFFNQFVALCALA